MRPLSSSDLFTLASSPGVENGAQMVLGAVIVAEILADEFCLAEVSGSDVSRLEGQAVGGGCTYADVVSRAFQGRVVQAVCLLTCANH